MPISAKTIEAWRCGSKDGLATSILLMLTLVPGVIFSFRGTEPSLYVYLFLPFNFLFASGSLPRSNSVLSIVIIVGVIAAFFGLVKLFEKWKVTHALAYFVWILYLSMLFFGYVFASVGIHPY
jgi:hypothetical protein